MREVLIERGCAVCGAPLTAAAFSRTTPTDSRRLLSRPSSLPLSSDGDPDDGAAVGATTPNPLAGDPPGVVDQHLQNAREAIDRATETADGPVRETLHSVEDAIDALGQAEGTDEPSDESDELDAVEEQLRGATDRADEETASAIREARDEFDAYRESRDTELSQ